MASEWYKSDNGADIRIVNGNRIDYIANQQIGTITRNDTNLDELITKIKCGEKLEGRYFEGHQFQAAEPMWE